MAEMEQAVAFAVIAPQLGSGTFGMGVPLRNLLKSRRVPLRGTPIEGNAQAHTFCRCRTLLVLHHNPNREADEWR